MKYLFFLSVVFLVACQGKNTTNTVPKKPSPKRFYNDFTGSKFLSVEQASSIESKLVKFNKETSNEIVVVIVNDFGGMEPAEFGTKLGAEWGVGNKDLDNGVVLLIKPTEKRKVFIATGRGTETILTDIQAKEIVDNQIIPSLKTNDFFSGIDKGLSSIMALLKGGNNSPEPSVGNASSNYSSTENSNNPEIENCSHKEELNKLLLRSICKSAIPFNFINNDIFREFCQFLIKMGDHGSALCKI